MRIILLFVSTAQNSTVATSCTDGLTARGFSLVGPSIQLPLRPLQEATDFCWLSTVVSSASSSFSTVTRQNMKDIARKNQKVKNI